VCACSPPWEAGRAVARKGGGLRFQMQVLRFKNTYIYISTSQKVYTVVTVLSILRLALYVCFIRGPSLVAVSFHGHQKLVPTSRVGGHSNGQAVKFNSNLVKTFQNSRVGQIFLTQTLEQSLCQKKACPALAPFSTLLWLAFKPSHMPQSNTSAPFSEFLPHLEYASDCMSFCCQPPCMPCDCQF